MDKLEIITEDVWQEFIKLLEMHHSLYKFGFVSAEAFEELLYSAIIKTKQNAEWKYRSHVSGADIVTNNVKISCKGGQYFKRKGIYRFSGSRTTKQKTIEDKIKYVMDSEDIIAFLSAVRSKDKTEITYTLRIMDAIKLDYNSLTWTRDEVKGLWLGRGSFSCDIVKSMSDQFWTEFPINLIDKSFQTKIKINH